MKSDRQLIELANKGDQDAFEALYYRHRDWVYRLARRFTGNQQDALDVLQETFTYFLSKFPGFELTASMTTFLYPAVKHISTAIQARKRRFSSNNDVLNDLAAPGSEKQADRGRSELAAVLNILPEDQREILLMRFVDDMRLADIAGALDIPLSTAKSRLYHALETLRNDGRTKNYFLE